MSKKSKLENICDLIDEKIMLNEIIKHNLIKMNYISTENMLPDKNGIIPSKSIPSIGKGGKYKRNDTLLSNIRPYFKKIWLAKDEGACSNDVLIFRAKENYHHDFLYYNLANDAFFEYAMKTSKGTKMPRGDKTAIKQYDIYDFDYRTQQKLTKLLRLLDDKIELNRQINTNLEQQAQAIFKSWFIDFEPFGGTMPDDWIEYRLGDFLPVITGKKNANTSSEKGRYPFFSCSHAISWTDEYSFDANAILVAGNGDFNVKWYNGKFEAYQRTYVLIPTISKYASWLYYAVKFHLSEITKAARGSVISFITKGNLEDFQLIAPKELNHFALIDQFAAINTTIDNNIKEIYNLSALRDTLLPKLMSGEIDVSKIEID